MTAAQLKLKEQHGVPEEFEAAVWYAFADLFITELEAARAIQRYRLEWMRAGDGIHPISLAKIDRWIEELAPHFRKIPCIFSLCYLTMG